MRCKTQHKIQYHSKRGAERASLSYFEERGAEAFGTYKCPHCLYWHLTSEYDNRSKQSKHEFRCSKEHLKALEKKKGKAKKHYCETLTLAEQREACKQLNNQPYKRWWQRLFHSLLD